MKIALGVMDMPYESGSGTATTHEVAEILEGEYQLFTHFYEQHNADILIELSEHLRQQISNAIQFDAPIAPTAVLGETGKAFSVFLEREEMAGLGVDGVPTQAALDGVSSRKKLRHGPRRPSFIDSGLLLSSFVVWVENDNAES